MKKGLFLTILFLLGLVVGVFAQTTYYYTGTGALDNNANWGTTQGATDAPVTYANSGNTLILATTATTANNSSAKWTVAATIQVGFATSSAVTFTIDASHAVAGSINVVAASSGSNTLELANTTVPSIGSLAAASTVIYDANGTQSFILPTTGATSSASGNYGNLVIGNTTTNPATLVSIGVQNGLATTISGNLTTYGNAYLTIGNTLTTVTGTLNINNGTTVAVTPFWNGAVFQSPSASVGSLKVGTINVNNGGTLFLSPGLSTVGLTGIIVNTAITIFTGGTLINPLNGAGIYGAGGFTIQDNSNIKIGNQFLIQTARARGFLRTTGTTPVFGTNPGPNVTVLGTIDTYSSTGFFSVVNNLTISLAAGFPLTLSKDLTVNGQLNLASGRLIIGNDPNNSNIAAALTLNGTIAGNLQNLVTYPTKSSLVLGSAYTGYTGTDGLSAASLIVPSSGDSAHQVNNLTIATGSQASLAGNLSVAGTLTLTSGSLNVGNNTLTLNGAAIAGANASTGLITTSASSLAFGGSSSSVFVPASVSAIGNLTLSNAVALNGPLALSGALTLNSGGKLTTTSANLLTLIGGSASTSAGSSTAYVNGPLAWQLPASASGTNYLFPIGAAGVYAPFRLLNTITSSSSSLGIVQAQVTHAATSGTAGTGIVALNATNYWATTVTNGSSITSATAQFNDPGNTTASQIASSASQSGTYNAVTTTLNSSTSYSTPLSSSNAFYVYGTEALPPPIVSRGTQSVAYGSSVNYSISATNSPTTYSATYKGSPISTIGLSLSGNTISGAPTVSGYVPIVINATNANGAGSDTLALNISANVYYIGAGSTSLSSASSWNLAADGTGAATPTNILTAENTTFNIYKTASTTAPWSLASGSVINVGDVANNNTGVTLTITSGNYITGGTINVYGNNLELKDASSNLSTLGTLDINSTVTYGAVGTQSFLIPTSGLYGNIEFGNTTTNPATVVNIASTVSANIAGTLDVYNNATLNIYGSSQVNGEFTVNTGGIAHVATSVILTATTVTVNANGKLVLDPGSSTIYASNDVSVAGTLDISSVQVSAITGTATLSLLSGSTTYIGSIYGIQSSGPLGAIQTTGTRIYSPGANYVFNGQIPQAVGTGFPSTVNNFTVNVSNGYNATLTSSLIVNGTLAFTSGNLVVGSNTITLNGGLTGITSNSNLVTTSASSLALGSSFTGTLPSAIIAINNFTVAHAVSLAAPLTVSGVLKLNSGGIITTTSTNLLTLTGAASSTSAGSTTAYVNGPLAWTLPKSVVSNNFLFPVGVSNAYAPVTLNSTSTSSAANAVVTIQANSGSTGGNTSSLTSLNSDYYWSTTATNLSSITSTQVQITDPATLGSTNAIGYSSTLAGAYTGSSASISGNTLTSEATTPVLSSFYVLGVSSAPNIISATSASVVYGQTYAQASPIYTVQASTAATFSATYNGTDITTAGIGLSINSTTGAIYGTPINIFGPAPIVVTATAGGGSASATVTFNVASSLYYLGSGSLNDPSQWDTKPDGTGGNPSSATIFSAANTVFNILKNATTVGGTWTLGTGSYINVGDIADVTTGAKLTIASGNSIVGTVNVYGNTLEIASTTLPTLGTIDAKSTIQYDFAGTQTITNKTYGNLIIGNGTAATNATIPAITVTGNFTQNTGSTVGYSVETVTVNGNYTQTGGTATLTGAYVVVSGTISLSGTTSFAQNNTFSDSYFTLNSSSAQFIVNSGATLTIANAWGFVQNSPDNTSGFGALRVPSSIAGSFNWNTNTSFNSGANYTLSTNQINSYTGGVGLGNGFPTAVNNLTISAGASFALLNNLSVLNTLTLSSSSTQLAVGSKTLTLVKNIATTPTGLITTSASSLVFSGSTSGLVIPTSVTALSNLTINNVNGVSLQAALALSGTLTLTSGAVTTTSSNLLTLGSAASVSGGSATSFVNGPVARTLPLNASRVTFLFPLGTTAGGYTPFSLATTSTATSGSIPVVTAQAFHTATGGSAGTNLSTINTNTYWSTSVTNASSITNTTVQFVDASYGSANTIGYSSTLNGVYAYLGGTTSGSIFTGSPASSLSPFYVLGFTNVPIITSTGNTASAAFGTTYTTANPIYNIDATQSPTFSALITSLSNAPLSTIGLTINPSTGLITGTPTTFGTFDIALSASTTGVGATTASTSITLTITGKLYYNSAAVGAKLDDYHYWYSATGGAGTQAPSNVFTLDNGIFEIDNSASTANNTSSWTISGLGAKIVVGSATVSPVTLTVASGFPIVGTVSVAAAAGTNTTNTLKLQDATLPTFGTLDATSTIVYGGSVAQAINTAVTYGNLTIANTNSITLPSASISSPFGAYITGNLTVANTLTVNAGSYVLLYGAYTSSAATTNINGSIVFPAGVAAYLTGTGKTIIGSTASVYLGDANGLNGTATGNIRTSGANNFVPTGGASFVLEGGAAQVTGSTFPATVNNLVVYNTATSTATLSSDVTVNGTLTLTKGSFVVGSKTLTFGGITANGGSLSTSTSSTLVLAGSQAGPFNLPTSVVNVGALTLNNTNATPATLNIGKALTFTTLNIASGKLNINSGIVLSVSGSFLQTGGTVSNNGTINLTNTTITTSNFQFVGSVFGGTLQLGATGNQTVSRNVNLTNLTINNGSASGNAYLNSTVNIYGIVTITQGIFNTTSGTVTLKSTSIANTAIVAPVLGSVTGNVTVERFIPAGYRAYRDVAPEVYNTSNRIYNTWQENGSNTSGYGTFITGPAATHADDGFYGANAAAAQPAPNSSNGLDYSINGNASAFTYDNANGLFNSNYGGTGSNTYTTGAIAYGIANTKTASLDPFTGYRLLIRGDRAFNLAKTPISSIFGNGLLTVNATTLRATGKLVTGTVTYKTIANGGVVNTATGGNSAVGLNANLTGFSNVANPYVSPVKWSNVYAASTGLNASFWYLDPTSSAAGKYIAYNALTGSAVSGYSSTSAVVGTDYIQPGQAFFVQNNNSSNAQVVFTEATKATATSNLKGIFGVTNPLSKIYVGLLKEDSVGVYAAKDAAAIAFRADFGNTDYGLQDALKFGNASDNLFISDKGKNLSIDGRLPAVANDVLPLVLSKVSGKKYQLVIDASAYDVSGYLPVLKDNFTGTVKALSIGIDTITFTVDSALSASFATRFSIAFKPTTLAVNSLVASATLSNNIATISWNTVGEKGVSKFEVEKSTDAKSFTKIGQATAKNTTTASYATTDNSVTAISYYRIKAISEVGTVSYSNLVQLTVNSKQFSVYPNPLTGKKLKVLFSNISAGKYTVTINNVLGQKVQEAAISHAGGNVTHTITVNNTLAAGIYSVTIRETASGTIVSQSNLSVN